MRSIGIIVSVLVFWASAAFADPEGFVIEAVMASPEADSPLQRDTAVEIADGGYIVIISRSGQLVRRDGPFKGAASSLLDSLLSPDSEELDNPVLSSLLELAEVSRGSEEQLGGVRGVEFDDEVHATAITAATTTYCLIEGARPEFYVSRAPTRDEPVTFRSRISPLGFLQTTWPVGVNLLAWPDAWPEMEEGRYIWSLGDRGPTPLRIRIIDDLPDSLPIRAAYYYDLRCETQAVALIRSLMTSANRQ
jgi:hypothetical protein